MHFIGHKHPLANRLDHRGEFAEPKTILNDKF